MGSINLSQNREQWRALVCTTMNPRFSKHAANIFRNEQSLASQGDLSRRSQCAVALTLLVHMYFNWSYNHRYSRP